MRITSGSSSSDDLAHTYSINLSALDARMQPEKFIRITPFNPLTSVRRAGQESRGDGSIGNMSVSLEALLTDCNDMPEGWREKVVRLIPEFRA